MSQQQVSRPVVTAALICFNHSRFVAEALESIKAQAYSNLYLVVVDDCSTDDSADIIRHWLSKHWPHAVFVAHEMNMGVCRSCNDALAHAKGKYLRLLSADDLWLPDSLSRQVEFMEGLPPDVGVLYSDTYQIEESGELFPKTYLETHFSFSQMPEGSIFNELIERNFIPAMTTLIRMSCFASVGQYDENLSFEDWDMWLRISRKFKFRYFPEPTAKYRIVETSMVRSRSAEIEESSRQLLLKCLRLGGVKRKMRKGVLQLEENFVRRAYRLRLPGRVTEAGRLFRYRPCLKSALLLFCVAIGLPCEKFERLLQVIRRAKESVAGH